MMLVQLNACMLFPQFARQLRWVCPHQRWWLVHPIWKHRWPPACQPMESPLVPSGVCVCVFVLLTTNQPTLMYLCAMALTPRWCEQVGDEGAGRSDHPRVQELWWDVHHSEWLHFGAQQRDTQGDAHLRYHLQRGGLHWQRHPRYSVLVFLTHD